MPISVSVLRKRTLLFIFMFFYGFSFSQSNPYSQQNAEIENLNKYELENPPLKKIPFPSKADKEEFFGSRLIRSVTLLETSSVQKRWPIKIVIYGQSIVASVVFTEELTKMLNKKFPYADITIENKAIGGFGGDRIIRTAEHDVYYSCPDLIIFHVYGGENGDLDKLFFNFRKYTTADILLLNHHLDNNGPGINEEAYKYIRYIANKYNCELVNVTNEWSQYVKEYGLNVTDLLRDNIHPNRNGNQLLVKLIERHLKYSSLFPSDWSERVKCYYLTDIYDKGQLNPFSFTKQDWIKIDYVPCGSSPGNNLKFKFFGNRIDFIAGHVSSANKLGSATIKIDGKRLSDLNLYAFTLPSEGPKTWWPAIRRISSNAPLREENWVLTVKNVNADSTVWRYSLTGSKTGFDGSGTTDKIFISNSGRVMINPSDFMFSEIKKWFHAEIPVGYTISWKSYPLFLERYTAPQTSDSTRVYKTTVVQGLTNDYHTLEIIPNGDGIVPIEAIEVHSPVIH